MGLDEGRKRGGMHDGVMVMLPGDKRGDCPRHIIRGGMMASDEDLLSSRLKVCTALLTAKASGCRCRGQSINKQSYPQGC